jgi:amino acid permease
MLIRLGALFSAHGLILLSKAAQRTGLPSSFYSAARATVPQYTILIDLSVALKCFGVATGYLITVGDCMVDAMYHILLTGDQEHDSRRWVTMVLSRQFWVVGAVFAVMPFSFFRQLDDLKKTSALALIFVFFLVFGIVIYAHDIADACPNDLENCRGEVVEFTDFPTTLSKLPIFIFAFTCHQNIFPIVNELHDRTQERLHSIIFASIGFSLVLFYVVAIEGYKTFGSNVKGDILVNYPVNGYVTSLRISIAFMLALHYPLQLDPSRRCISSLIAAIKGWTDGIGEKYCRSSVSDDESSNSSGSVDTAKKSFEKDAGRVLLRDNDFFRIVTVSFLFLSFSVAMLVDDLGVVLAAVGSTGSTLVTFILPGLIYLNLRSSWDFAKIMACVQLILGCLIMPIALYYLILGKAVH